MTVKDDVVKRATRKVRSDNTAGIRVNNDEKKEIQSQAKSLGLNFTELLLGCWRFVKDKL